MPGGFVPYHHSTGKPYKKKSTTSSVSSGVTSFSSGVSKGASKVYGGSPSSYGYVPPTSTSTTSSSSSSAAAAKAVAQAQAAVKAAKAVVSEYGKDKKNPKSVSGKYAKATEKAKKKREKTKVRVERKTREVKAKYDATPKKLTKTPKFGPGNAYTVWEGSNKIASKARELAGGSKPLKPTGARQRPSQGRYAPKPRKVAKRLQKAVKRAVPKAEVPSVVPKQYRDEVAKYGKMLDPVVPKGMSGSEYLGKMIQFESGWDPNAVGPPIPGGSARGLGQFIPGTAQTFKSEYGVDPYGSPKQAIKAAAMHASGEYGHAPLYAGYNPGYSSTDPIPGVDGGKTVTVGKGKPIPPKLKRTARQTLGKQPTKAILQGGKVVKDKNAGEEESGAPSYKETKQYIVPTEARSEISAEQRAPARTMVTGMDPALQAALVQLAKNTGIPVRINEGYRTEARANDFPSGTASQHHQGNASDIDNNADYSAEDLAKVGLNNTAVGGEPWHFQLNNPDATASTVNTNIPIKGTNLAVKVPTPTSTSGATGTTTSGGTSSTGAPVPGTPEYQQMMNEVRRRRGPSVAKRLAAIDRWMTSPVTAPTPEISQELIDRILGK